METQHRVERLERRQKILSAMLIATFAGLIVVGLRQEGNNQDHLRVKQITIVDDKGTERVWIGAPVPDPIIHGEVKPRSGPISGVILLDAKGNERAGFATSDNIPGEVFMGLDSEKGQEARFIINPGGGGHLTFFDKEKNYARIGIWPDRPALELREKGETVFEGLPSN